VQVKLSKGVRAHWTLLKSRLKKICNMDGAVLPLWSTRPAAESFGPPFLLSVSSYDRQGFLHGTPPPPTPVPNPHSPPPSKMPSSPCQHCLRMCACTTCGRENL